MLQKRIGRPGALAMALAAALMLGAGAAAQPVSVTMAISSEPSTLDPQKTMDGGERRVNDNVFDALLSRNAESELSPGLAIEMPKRLDDTTWQFKLRRGVKFHNGEPFDADAVVHSVTRIFDPNYKSTALGDLTGIKGAEKVDDLTVNIKTERLDNLLPSRMYWLKIVPVKASQDAAFAQKPIGTGPYRVVEWARGSHVQLERNPDYWGERPQIERARFRFVSEGGTALAGLIADEFDFVDNLQAEFAKQVPQLANRRGLEHPFAALSTVSGPTRDKRVRQALNYAVDKAALAEELFQGFATPARGQMIGDKSFGFNDQLKPWPYDPARAKALIKEAGAEGATIEFVVPAGRWPKAKEMGEAISGYWQAAGLKPDLKVMEFSQYLQRLRDRRVRPDAIYASHNNALLEAERTVQVFYQSIPKATSSSVDDPILDQWVEAASKEPDNDKRKAIYHQLMQRGYDEAYFLFLLNTDDVYGLSKRIDWKPRLDNKVLLAEFKLK
jgi:peptide/nickel transport system substrate-binding protein